jgi:hypothetical protein
MEGQEALWSALEVKTQAAQARGQVTVWDALDEIEREAEEAAARGCEGCGAEPFEPCRLGCLGLEQ